MQLFDSKVKDNIPKALLQCALAGLAILLVLTFFDFINDLTTNVTIIACVGSSTFVIFALPHNRTAQPRRLIGGYVVALTVGCLAVVSIIGLESFLGPIIHSDIYVTLFGAIAISITMFLMVWTNTEHPPAVGATLGLIVSGWNIITLAFIIISVIILSMVHVKLKNRLIDLA